MYILFNCKISLASTFEMCNVYLFILPVVQKLVFFLDENRIYLFIIFCMCCIEVGIFQMKFVFIYFILYTFIKYLFKNNFSDDFLYLKVLSVFFKLVTAKVVQYEMIPFARVLQKKKSLPFQLYLYSIFQDGIKHRKICPLQVINVVKI